MRLPHRADLLAPLGRLIESHRMLRGWSQWELASYCGFSQNTVGNLEAARHRPLQKNLVAILQAIRTDEDAQSGLALSVLRAPGYRPSTAADEARRLLQSGGLLDAAWAFVRTQDAGSWAIRCSKEDVRVCELQAPLRELVAELQRGAAPRIEQMILLGLGAGHIPMELARETARHTALQSVWLLDPSPLLLQHAERGLGSVLDSAALSRTKNVRQAAVGVQALCIDYRDLATLQRLFIAPRPFPFGRFVVLGAGALDHATDDWRELNAAAGLASDAGDLLLIEHRRAPADDGPDPVERALAEWWGAYLQESARWVSARLSGSLRSVEGVLEATPAPSALSGVTAEDKVARVRGPDGQEREIRIRWRRAYEEEPLDRWLAAHGLRLRGRWAHRFGSRCWALYERVPLEEQDHEN